MASNYPTSLDNFTNPSAGASLSSPSHSTQHGDANDAIEALEAKLGIGSSAASAAINGMSLFANGSGGSSWGFGGTRIIQLVRATDTTTRTTTSSSYVDASLSVTITPRSASSNVLVIGVFLGLALNSSTGANQAQYQITTSGNTALSGAEGALIGTVNYTQSTGYAYSPVNIFGWASPATTSATTYKVRYRAASANTTAYMANGDMTAQIFALEISA